MLAADTEMQIAMVRTWHEVISKSEQSKSTKANIKIWKQQEPEWA